MNKLIPFVFVLALISCQNEDKPMESTDIEVVDSFSAESFVGQDYLIDDQHSYIGFRIKYFGFSPVRGRFDEFDGTVFYDSSGISNLSVSIAIDVSSINTGNETRDDDLKREGTWFDAANFPYIHFRSTQVIPKNNGEFDLIGDISIKGISKEVTFSFQKPTDMSKDWAGNDQVDFSGKVTINRQDFQVFGGDFWSSVMENGLTQLSDEVEIELDVHCRKADYQIRYNDADSLDLRKTVLDKIRAEGIDESVGLIDELFEAGSLSPGKLSTIGYTLNAWQLHDEAAAVFSKRLEFYPKRHTSWNQLGITSLFKKDYEEARSNFETALKADSTDSRALEYIKLIGLLNKSQ